MGMKDDLKQVQDTRIAGKETSTEKEEPANLVDPGPFTDATLDEPEEKAAEKEPEQEEEKEEEETEKPEEEKEEEKEEEVSPEKIEIALKKYKTPEEAAKAAYNAQKRMHEATNETARLKKENEELKRQQQTYTPPPVQQKPEIPVEDAIADKYYADIERLKEDDPERDKKVVKLMAKMNAEISEATRTASERKNAEIQRHIQGVETQVRELGLDENLMEDFWIYAGNAPKHLNRDGAIQWTIDRINRLKGDENEVKKETLEKVRKDEKEKKRMSPLGKGGIKPATRSKDEEPNLSLGEALAQMRRQRVYK